MATAKLLTHTQVGTVGEITVASQLMLLSEGRLTSFLPLADDDGIDLLVFDKLTGKSLPVQVKARTKRTFRKPWTVQFDVRKKTYNDRDGAFVLAILLDTATGSIDRSWLVSMSVLPEVAGSRRDKYIMVPSANDHSSDRYSPYRCDTMAEVVRRLSSFLDED